MKPPLSCKNCRARKKKCDRAFPVCSYCLKTHNSCVYRAASHQKLHLTPGVSLSPPPSKGEQTGSQILCLNGATFLGFPSPNQTTSSPPGSVDLPSIGVNLWDSICVPGQKRPKELVRNFIHIAGFWMPFIPRRDLEQLAHGPSSLKAEDIILLACMNLVTEKPAGGEPANKIYLTVKSSFVNMEIYGVLSIRLLQALILLLFYEHGHGMYPAAYITLGTCARYLSALGITTNAEHNDGKGKDWLEVEVRRRLWWSVFVVERIVSLSYPQRPLVLKELSDGQILPSDDISWQQESPSSSYQELTLLSLATSDMGTFRLLVHAGYLLDRVIHLVSDQDIKGETFNARREQLYRTMTALMSLLEVEEECSIASVRVARNVLNSALFVLFPIEDSHDTGFGALHDPKHPLNISARTWRSRCRMYLKGDLGGIDEVYPFLTHWGVCVFRYYQFQYDRDGHVENMKALVDARTALEMLDGRWRLAGVYMSLLNASQVGEGLHHGCDD